MATFPTDFKMSVGAEDDIEDGLFVERSVNGQARARSLYTTEKRRFSPRFRLSKSERDTLLTFYHTNRNLTFSFVWPGDGQTYTCIFDGPPKITYTRSLLLDVTVPMRQA